MSNKAAQLAHNLGYGQARGEAESLLRWVAVPLERRLREQVQAGAQELLCSPAELRILWTICSGGLKIPDAREGLTYLGRPVRSEGN